ncbi:MAG: hypothetical protein A3B31_00825 [Candidatus Komeilibacteria bacterium RIFCSPLOWO2_01_FULL_53_11]|uniref:Nudix hydrolase domain-containing protein n=1 Tax=Candidatus Komeilibacteria bacterium RIFCSPLOWO2_01_FULL_53_11 TaxID=1798552 RepID=A0A1G2BQ70_9BACT|nr:MAG: hypothetical protein A3B31_00825 [Candidatus Komeilibacteria bacterium RIFCSPLOWO2_01_FULL_53_11]
MQPGFDYIGVNVGFICHDGNGRVLLHLRSDKNRDEHNTWDLGAGQVEFGEQLEEALVREVLEEYGCKPLEYRHLAQRTVLREHEGKATHWLVNIYAVRVNPNEVRVMEPEKNLGNAWYELDSLPEPMHSSAGKWLREYRDQIENIFRQT